MVYFKEGQICHNDVQYKAEYMYGHSTAHVGVIETLLSIDCAVGGRSVSLLFFSRVAHKLTRQTGFFVDFKNGKCFTSD
ncbi:hypothetical protein J6590_099009 [Homalodisca vitripennis]|nr:hypothetical protein J6590_099009 [Homalodisca vitripennis]